ncbi:uncharacterized protein K444DRAFT_632852 [Hyaloscypha bicolor E]|uniref:Uncharacterized protein n=1 Tax=Hyaloscypha bicolor E TaxID=1095630 RepID=A0A2J6T0D3_9HELO|nr:uncharacterized protein K444DRAFT_632852 [Hyaloscypha bicolor E]PMD56449.1 hypothetical protein K444DRAFT_632852 [Hyaloscypha bicolor E]
MSKTSDKWHARYSPQGTVNTQFSKDREIVTFVFDKFQAFIGPSASQTDGTKQTRNYISDSDTSTDWNQGSAYEKVDIVKSASAIWSPCGVNGILNVNNRIGLSNERGAPAIAAALRPQASAHEI